MFWLFRLAGQNLARLACVPFLLSCYSKMHASIFFSFRQTYSRLWATPATSSSEWSCSCGSCSPHLLSFSSSEFDSLNWTGWASSYLKPVRNPPWDHRFIRRTVTFECLRWCLLFVLYRRAALGFLVTSSPLGPISLTTRGVTTVTMT